MIRHHPISVAAPRHILPSPLPATSPPVILERDEDFITSTLADLARPEGREALVSSIACTPSRLKVDGRPVVKLFQPIQRRFHLALIEAWCDGPGSPRLDPAAVEAAGLVVRRLTARPEGSDTDGLDDFHRRWVPERWMRFGEQPLGWRPVDPFEDGVADPSAAVRASLRSTGVAGLDRLLLPLLMADGEGSAEEDVMPMFVAPPETCQASGHTLFYGLISTASQERASAPADIDAVLEQLNSGSDFRRHLVGPLQGGSFNFPDPPQPDRCFDSTWATAFEQLARQEAPRAADAEGGARAAGSHWLFRQLLLQLAVEFDAFAENSSAQALRATLRRIRLPCSKHKWLRSARSVPADRFLHQAVRVLLDREEGVTVEMPEFWPKPEADIGAELHQRLNQALGQRLGELVGRRGRYDREDALYAIRSFVRLKPRDGCPARTVWSAYSQPFVIAAWYESVEGSDPVAISLPDVSDRDQLRSLKPNVSFVVPPKLADLLRNDGSDLMEGKANGASLDIQWICGFSLPIITLCAFIVLNIFLSLLNIFLGWLLYVKVCIPFPKPSSNND